MKDISLFRYRTINSYSINALMNDEVYASTPNNFNDPYDVVFVYDTDEIIKLILENNETLRDIYDDFAEYYKKKNQQVYSFSTFSNDFKINSKNYHIFINNIVKNAMTLFRKRQLVACFSRNIQSEIMWAHYANYGKGFVIEYSKLDLDELCNFYLNEFNDDIFNNSKDKSLYGCFAVNYSSTKCDGTKLAFNIIREYYRNRSIFREHRKINLKYTHVDYEEFKNITLNKIKDWSYENEVRIILPNNTKLKESELIGKCKPYAVYLGEFIEQHNKYLILNICRNKKIPVYQMKSLFSTKRFGLKMEKYTEKEIDRILNLSVNTINISDDVA